MEETEVKTSLKEILKEWGRYEFKENCIYLYSNRYLQDERLIQTLKNFNIKIQLNLFE